MASAPLPDRADFPEIGRDLTTPTIAAFAFVLVTAILVVGSALVRMQGWL